MFSTASKACSPENAGAGGATSVGAKLTKVGAGTLTLLGTNIYTGLTTITKGTLAVSGAGSSIGTGNITVQSSAIKFSIQSGVLNAISDSATLTLAGGGTAGTADFGYLQLGAGVSEIAGSLVLGAIAQPAGTYGSSLSSALFKNDEYFSGAGTLTVVPEPGAAVMLLGGFGVLAGWRRLRRLC
ncbi:MAG: hypothetical protein JWL59_1772 [Chthoniobacteraceae bacterium]|nr:hypothetical protein [Chthoniobacteraceae bacterium]